jgi:hypothetical protein
MPITIVLIVVAVLFFRSPIARAIADNMRGQRGGAADPTLGRQLEALREELHDVRADVTELAERLDFTERMLADVRRRDALPG